ncbi:uncharacterized protein LOC120187417 [Hibiscus syriacus]|uniref:uncharacterized protein LOC120187417 n=1 Tax=Hibiscus syriacus TaxID=106335 RepID=UPI0019238F36|nr:uncharacterized protein LOC120187417 [Hibiscus syriacus]
MRSHRLEKMLLGSVQLASQTVVIEHEDTMDNKDYKNFVAQDSFLVSWLLSTVSPQLLRQLVGVVSIVEIWITVNKFFVSSKERELNMQSYISQIKEICDALATSGSPMSDQERIATILGGLPTEYRLFVTIILDNRDLITLDGVISILLDVELQQQKNFEQFNGLSISANMDQSFVTNSSQDAEANTFSSLKGDQS